MPRAQPVPPPEVPAETIAEAAAGLRRPATPDDGGCPPARGAAMKAKPCARCGQAATVAYRFQIAPSKSWLFACPACLLAEQAKPGYRYGGTWKGARH